MSVLLQIADHRRARIAREGHAQGLSLPAVRPGPIVPFGRPPFLVCEIKRKSPSKGAIAPGLDAAQHAGRYIQAGVRSLSILTEQDSFAGSLQDLVDVRRAFPDVAILRKDFLLDEEDLRVSWQAGADAVLLIAALLDRTRLETLHRYAEGLGLQPLVEIHDDADVEKCRALAPGLTGINARDLGTFTVDLLHPLAMRPRIPWKTRLLFESGIRSSEDVRVALVEGFAGVLVGETAVRTPGAVGELIAGFGPDSGQAAPGFWGRLAARRRPGRPLVKVCGITRARDGELAVRLGADALGFVFASSPRRAGAAVVRELRGVDALKVAVVVEDDAEAFGLLRDGLIDAVQLHGDHAPDACARAAFPYYKAVRVRGAEDIRSMADYRCPRVLADAFADGAAHGAASAPRGGTGKAIPGELVLGIGEKQPLWLAGGLGPDTVAEAILRYRPELIDASSKLESAPGEKDPAKLERFFQEIEHHAGT